jgi:hypothetical protein
VIIESLISLPKWIRRYHIADVFRETAEIVRVNPLIPQSWGTFLKLGDTPRPPAGSVLHLSKLQY